MNITGNLENFIYINKYAVEMKCNKLNQLRIKWNQKTKRGEINGQNEQEVQNNYLDILHLFKPKDLHLKRSTNLYSSLSRFRNPHFLTMAHLKLDKSALSP